ncbi:MAG: hypothetical protein ACPIOQ_24000 [Promethearchaeia archaeon]
MGGDESASAPEAPHARLRVSTGQTPPPISAAGAASGVVVHGGPRECWWTRILSLIANTLAVCVTDARRR